jgi:hypothetical protein
MADIADVDYPDIGLPKDSHPASPQIFHRISVCGHLDVLVEPQLLENRKKWHNLIAFESSKEHNRAEHCPVYIEARCLDCAIEAEEEDDTYQTVQPKRTLGSYRAGTSSTYAKEAVTTSQGGFDNVLERQMFTQSTCNHHTSPTRIVGKIPSPSPWSATKSCIIS